MDLKKYTTYEPSEDLKNIQWELLLEYSNKESLLEKIKESNTSYKLMILQLVENIDEDFFNSDLGLYIDNTPIVLATNTEPMSYVSNFICVLRVPSRKIMRIMKKNKVESHNTKEEEEEYGCSLM